MLFVASIDAFELSPRNEIVHFQSHYQSQYLNQ